MSISVRCECGRAFEFGDQFARQAITCPDCQRHVLIPDAPAVPAQVDAVLERDRFLINRRAFRIDTKYDIADESGQVLLFAVRPTFLLRSLGAIAGGIAAACAWVYLFGSLSDATRGGLAALLAFVTVLGGLAVFVATAMALSRKRHVTFYRDETMGTPLFEVLQDRKFQPIVATYTLRDATGKVLATFRKNFFTNFVRKKWYALGPDGRELCMAIEDSPLKAFLRRFIGPFFGLLRTNFNILAGESDQELGHVDRKFTLFDKHVLDLSADPRRTMDRRVALALGVMLDTGERR